VTNTLAQIMNDSLDMTQERNYCKNCLDEIHTPDDRTGVIHKHGKYACFTYTDTGKAVRMSNVAEKGN
jgi:hypothetical protein